MRNIKIITFCLLTFFVIQIEALSTDDGGINASGSWNSSGGGFQLNWNISKNGNNYHYIYSITNESGGSLAKPLKNFLLEIDPIITKKNYKDYIFNSNVQMSQPISTNKLHMINFKVNSSDPIIKFSSTLAPAWGDFYGWGGTDENLYATNTNFGKDPSMNEKDFFGWTPTPGTGDVPIPEPTTILLLGTGLAAIAMKRKAS